MPQSQRERQRRREARERPLAGRQRVCSRCTLADDESKLALVGANTAAHWSCLHREHRAGVAFIAERTLA